MYGKSDSLKTKGAIRQDSSVFLPKMLTVETTCYI